MHRKPEIRKTAARVAASLFRSTPAREYVWLDFKTREMTSGWRSHYMHNTTGWFCFKKKVSFNFKNAPWPVCGLASFHANGYIREAALDALSRHREGEALPFLLIRLNDWVDQVQKVALSALTERFQAKETACWVQFLPLLDWLKNCRRQNHTEFVERVSDILKKPESTSALIDGMDNHDRKVRYLSYQLGLENQQVDTRQTIDYALKDNDTLNKIWAARKAGRSLSKQDRDYFLPLMKKDPFMPVRREALIAIAENKLPGFDKYLRDTLFDPHRVMRGEARYYLSKIGVKNFHSIYSDALKTQETPLKVILMGIGETGTEADIPLLLPFIDDSQLQVRKAALKALSLISRQTDPEIFLKALQDKYQGVSKIAREHLASRIYSLQPRDYWEVFKNNEPLHIRLNTLFLFSCLNKWESIFYLLKSYGTGAKDIEGKTMMFIKKWLADYNRSFIQPGKEELKKIKKALASCSRPVDSTPFDSLEKIITTWKI